MGFKTLSRNTLAREQGEVMKVIAVRPNCSSNYQLSVQALRAIEPPHWMLILGSAYYKANKFIDAEAYNLSFEETVASIEAEKPNRIVIFPTGSHPSAFVQQLDEANRLKKHFVGTIEVTIVDKLPVNPIDFGGPQWISSDISRYRAHNWLGWTNDCQTNNYGTLYTSISCPFKCQFCTVKNYFNTAYQRRALKDIFHDIDKLNEFSFKNIKIMDELFILDKDFVKKICEYIITKGYTFNIWCYGRIDTIDSQLLAIMKKAGINWISYGIESGSEKIRKKVTKGSFTSKRIKEVVQFTKAVGVAIVGNYMFGFYDDSLSTMGETLDLAMELQCEYSNFYCVTAYPNTPLYEQLKQTNLSLPKKACELAQMSEYFKPLDTKFLTGKSVLAFRDEAFNTYFTHNSYLTTMKNLFGQKVIDDIAIMTQKKLIRK
jgi:radical SAM superfamily enzyme YgiQ (UPF0313 family)